jgi:putative PEP-CTERM system histidine kinase
MNGLPGIWSGIGFVAYIAGAIAASLMALWTARRASQFGVAGATMAFALALTAVWSVVCLGFGPGSLPADIAEIGRNLGWLFVLFRLFSGDGRLQRVRPIRYVVFALGFVELLHPVLLYIQLAVTTAPEVARLAFHLAILFHLLVAVGGLVLVHNLYAGAARGMQSNLRWPSYAMIAMWLYDLNYFTIAYLVEAMPEQLAALRGLVPVAMTALAAIGSGHSPGQLRFSPSRSVAFQSASLVVIGAYLIAMVAIGRWLSLEGGDFAGPLQTGFIITASVIAAVLLPSRRLRGAIKVQIAKHLFQHRYDYRAEWLRFTRTIGRAGPDAPSLHERVVQAVADITESPAGLLLVPGDSADLELGARWQWPTADVPSPALPGSASGFFEHGSFVVDLDDVRAGADICGEGAVVADWLRADPRCWALVPLIHYDRLIGVVVLARPLSDRKLDWEDFDLLRVVGQQLASYLSENAGQEALAEAERFDDFHRRIAFVMHDIKNLASQMGLLARNAELHADNPEFRADMLVTLRNSADKLNTLLARLSRYGASSAEPNGEIALGQLVRDLVERFAVTQPVMLAQVENVMVTGNREALEQALAHLVQNGLDASEPDSPVFISVSCDGLNGLVEVVDSGHGMSAEFIRGRLFKPFDSSKQGGFGIGAYEARELVRAMGGRIEVESREGLGTRFAVRLPLAVASELLQQFSVKDQKVA